MTKTTPTLALLVAGALALAGCSAEGGGRVGGGRDAGPPVGGESGNTLCTNGLDDDGDGDADCADPGCQILVECGGTPPPPPPSLDGGFAGCDAIEREARTDLAPVDIVWVIDNSGSMSEEASLVQSNINDFSTAIATAGIDVHVVVITAPGFVTVPPPLGDDPTAFLRVEEDVQSSNSLEKLVSTFPRYEPFLRRSAVMHFIVVTDDESDLGADAFRSQMTGLLGKNFRVHAIASPPGCTSSPLGIGFEMPGCAGPEGDAADNGEVYWELSMDTGGRQFSICAGGEMCGGVPTVPWSNLFSELSASIAVPLPLPCVYQIPAPPEGESFDPGQVNVVHSPGGGGTSVIPFVGDFSRCPADGHGWYYEGPEGAPERIVVCPGTCALFESSAEGSVNIALGCATVLI